MSLQSRKLAPARRLAAVVLGCCVAGAAAIAVAGFVQPWLWLALVPAVLLGLAAYAYRSATTLLPVCVGSVPPLAPAFQPRDEVRAAVAAARAAGRDAVLTCAADQPGGVGTSQLAAWHAHRARQDRADLVVWVDPTGPGAVMTAFAMAAVLVDAPGHGETDPAQDARALLDWLSGTDRSWLVVFDGVTDPAQVAAWWPERHSPSGWFLATTRLPGATASAARAVPIEVGPFTEQESRAYLTTRLARPAGDGDGGGGIDEVARRLGHHPLALSHAAAYLVNEGVTGREYLTRLDGRAPGLSAAAATALLAAEAANRLEPVGLALPALRLAATLDPAGHPAGIWRVPEVTRYLTEQRAAGGQHPREPVDHEAAMDAISLVHRCGLVSAGLTDPVATVRMHPDTAAAVRAATPEPVLGAAARAAADALLAIWPDPDGYPDGAAYVAVLRANADRLARLEGDPLWRPDGHELLFRAGMSLTLANLHRLAEDYWRTLLAAGERVLGPRRDHVVTARRQVAIAMNGQGRGAEARPLLEGVVADSAELDGERAESTLSALEHLAIATMTGGATAEAVLIARRLLDGRTAANGAGDEKTLKASWILATCYRYDGRPREAIASLQPVVAGYTATLGPDDPNTRSVRETMAALKAEAARAAGDRGP
jgi:hypothetical protein